MIIRNELISLSKKLHVYSLLWKVYVWLSITQRVPSYYLKHKKMHYAEFYAKRQDKRALQDSQTAVGGMWEEMGKLQFDFIISKGLKPEHNLLDIGCGSLRGGLWFIRYLNTSNYWGIDISRNILSAGRNLVVKEGLESKEPNLIVNRDLSFREFKGRKFNYILAQSVFTHMPDEDIEECFSNLRKILKPNSLFFTTFNKGSKRWYHRAQTVFRYPESFFYGLGEKYGYGVQLDDAFIHPKGQKMLVIRLK